MIDSTAPIFYFTRMLPAYRIPVMERLNERLKGRLIVCYGQPPRGNPVLMGNAKHHFETEFLTNRWIGDTALHYQPYESVFEKHGAPAVVLAEESPRSVKLPFLLRHARQLGAGRVLWGIFHTVHRPFNPNHPLQRYRLMMARRVEACACYTRSVRDKLAHHLPDQNLFVAQNTLDSDTLFELHEGLSHEGRTNVRQRLGFPADQPLFVFVAQLSRRKGTRELLDFFEQFTARQPASLAVIGDGPERTIMEQIARERQLEGVRFLGKIAALDESAPYLYAGDILVMPGYVGLAINHAFALGLPVLTVDPPEGQLFHGPEIESLTPNENGLSVEFGDTASLVEAAHAMLDDRERFSQNALQYAQRHLTLDHMVDGLVNAISHAYAHAR